MPQCKTMRFSLFPPISGRESVSLCMNACPPAVPGLAFVSIGNGICYSMCSVHRCLVVRLRGVMQVSCAKLILACTTCT